MNGDEATIRHVTQHNVVIKNQALELSFVAIAANTYKYKCFTSGSKQLSFPCNHSN